MKSSLLTFGALAALSTVAAGQSDDVYIDGRIITGEADFDGDGADDIVITDPATGQFTVGFGSGNADFVWWPTARPLPTGGSGALDNLAGNNTWAGAGGFAPFDPAFRGGVSVAVGDVTGDGVSDYILTSVRHPAVYVFQGSRTRANALTVWEKRPLGAGPAGIAVADLDSSVPGPELAAPLQAELPPCTVIALPRQSWHIDKAAVDVMIAEVDERLSGFGVLPGGLTTSGGRHSGNLGAWLYRKGNGSQLRLARFYATGAPAIKPQAEPWTKVLAANMRGSNGPGQFVLWGEGLDALRIMTVHPSTANDDRPTEEVAFYYNRISFVYAASRTDGRQNIAVGHSDGKQIAILAWDGAANRFNAVQNLQAPAGRKFRNLAGTRNGLLVILDDGTFAKHEFNAGGQLAPVRQGLLPAMAAAGGHATVMLYTDDPLSGKALEFESFAAGNWTTSASFAGGHVSAMSEVFQSEVLGLGSAVNIVLTPSGNPGPAARAQGNQFGDASSSIFYTGGVSGGGEAAVQISPPPGVYRDPVRVKFAPAKTGTSVVYRLNGKPWQQAGPGGVYLTEDTLVEYYGQSAGGALSTIRSAAYDIAPQLSADKNRDGLPDTLAASLGLDPGNGDADGDGASDGTEILNGTDPRSAASKPANTDVKLPPSLKIAINVETPRTTGSLTDTPVPAARFTLFTSEGTPLHRDGEVSNGNGYFTSDYSLAAGSSDFERALIAEIELPGTDAKSGGASLFGMAFSPGFELPKYEAGATVEKWAADTRAALAEWKTTGLDTWGGTILINSDSTIGVAAFSAWTARRLAEAGVQDAGFAWDHRDSRSDQPAHEIAHVRQQLKLLEHPVDERTPAYDLGAVAQDFYKAITTGTTYAPLRTVAREMIRRDLTRTATGGRPLRNAAQALLHFLDKGELEPYYAAAISQPLPVLTALRAQLLNVPQPRTSRAGTGILRSMDGGKTWAVQTAEGELIALLGERRTATVNAGGVVTFTSTVNVLPGQSMPMLYDALASNDSVKVRVWGFTPPPGEVRPAGTDSAILLESIEVEEINLRTSLNDTDHDRLDDAFEQRYFGTLDFTFDGDEDGDGYTTGEEYFYISNPASAASRPSGPPAIPHNIVTIIKDGPLTLAWDGRKDVTYSVQESADLGSWTQSSIAPVETSPNRFEWTNPAPGSRRFVRIETKFE